MLKNKILAALALGGMAVVGLVIGIGHTASAQTATTVIAPVSATVTTQTVDTPEPGDVADAAEPATHKHAPLGGDGVVSSVSGSTIVVAEESDEGAAAYTIDASKATVTNNGVAASLSDVKVGQKIFVQGTTSGTNVSATSISIGHGGKHIESANDTDAGTANEASEPAGSTDASDK